MAWRTGGIYHNLAITIIIRAHNIKVSLKVSGPLVIWEGTCMLIWHKIRSESTQLFNNLNRNTKNEQFLLNIREENSKRSHNSFLIILLYPKSLKLVQHSTTEFWIRYPCSYTICFYDDPNYFPCTNSQQNLTRFETEFIKEYIFR